MTAPIKLTLRTRLDRLPEEMFGVAALAGLSVNVAMEAILCRQLGIPHPHTETVRRALIIRNSQRKSDTLPLE